MMRSEEVTRLLREWQGGESEALESLFDEIFHELKILARARFKGERSDHTLQPTALVNEVYLRLRDSRQTDWKNRAYFFGACATMMRFILIDYARRRKAERNGGGAVHLTLGSFEEKLPGKDEPCVEILALDQALIQLGKLNEDQARVVELRFFADLTIQETANVLGVSPTVVKRRWIKARAFLNHALGPA